MTEDSFQVCADRVSETGLAVRGAFHAAPGDGVPGAGGGTVLLIGNAGSAFWPAFRASDEYRDGRPDPLDRWSERVIGALARELDARAVFPFRGPPYFPFQKWAQRAEAVFPSPLGMLIHSQYGLWHAYRGALVFERRLQDVPRTDGGESPCLSCAGQPCLQACPVGAYSSAGFDVDACAVHLRGVNTCTDEGCRARNACPAGKPFRYMREQHRFHLAAFLRARSSDEAADESQSHTDPGDRS